MIDWVETNSVMLGYVGSEVWFEVHKPVTAFNWWRIVCTDQTPEGLITVERDGLVSACGLHVTGERPQSEIVDFCETAVGEHHHYVS